MAAERHTVPAEAAPITVSIAGAAKHLGCSPADVRRLCVSGRLQHVRLGRNLIVIAPAWLADITPDDLKKPPPSVRAERTKAPAPFIGDVVYFIEAPSARLIKIGTSRYVDGRIRTLRSGSPVALRLLGCVAGNVDAERELHGRFAKLRKHGEWFRATDDLRRFIADALADHGLPING